MAVGRVGGTKSLISGQVGNNIYQIVPDGDGGYSQKVMSKPESYRYTNTDKQALQRMKICVVETAMRHLKRLLGIAFQSARNKTVSVNMFSSLNYSYVDRDTKDNWYGGNQFYYPVKGFLDTLGGHFLISSGTLKVNAYKAMHYRATPSIHDPYYYDHWFDVNETIDGVVFGANIVVSTVGDFLKYSGMMAGDVIGLASYYEAYTYNDPSDPEEEPRHEVGYLWALVEIAYGINPATPLSQAVVERLFKVTAKTDVSVLYGANSNSVFVGFKRTTDNPQFQFMQHAAFTSRYVNGRRLVSKSWLDPVDDSTTPIYSNRAPADVFYSWIGTGAAILPSPY